MPRPLVGLLDPRKILIAAVLVAAAGVMMGYADVQDRAARELALRQGPPPPVAIQDFRRGVHEGPAREVRIHGELATGAAVTFPVRGREPLEWVMVVPVHPVSELGASILAGGSPDEKGLLAAQAERRVPEAPLLTPAIGMAVVALSGPEAAPASVQGLAEAVLGTGDRGTLVTLNGFSMDPGDLALQAHGALAARGVLLEERFLAMAPFVAGRVAALSAPPAPRQKQAILALALALAVLAAALQVRKGGTGASTTGAPVDDDDDTLDYVPPPPDRHPNFAPLASQGEILAADRVAAERAMSPHLLAAFIGRISGGKETSPLQDRGARALPADALRNRPARREDEAL